ncbi:MULTISPECIES: 4-(cytidine 5'-diphospho)-2-C-methyl-D-erythritol kinase [Clostridium]|uniref:4-diphosphocytidyl-2-C-methyl-D-erythritol kinase n=1 Tax=Clostridium cadaveris TaxID=1529 RepID=A0A1I2LEV3_9CLOT|nr:4-(cytidine 5'-diphospho)-2-C-methyl-D-erythritol kinase [Clostridium cadaveris]MDU4951369.1 4-(cytidine 5'-diphospho)-2-C-methyl-D-erythritol kinase [Clostridium sp.]MDM8310639.1 4-(cytidine 5'-diphospho)-2-C-methyl-D-erythritol kinase [Clostridium cadaveris]MDY4950653.1 4-(cytidine 5'-diphospho)-2-C-methyl-D-erythritol kinase [Clostridium cadaveris]NME65186.1 4-(cytidine 5'-diphospho)-2-C-methyl-D-erythritol kinase [Clostridium cadaveris]NWK10930.1 4-(cytidine 5'-diphospho)-2-C-methyl-D-e
MKVKAYGKVNLSLDIVGKREDGYHFLEMIMQTIDLYDVINVVKIPSGIEIKCNKNYVPTDRRNIAYRAAELFLETFKIKNGVRIEIEKNIPVAAGLAGGSTDGAAVIKAMNNLFNVNVPKEKLAAIGVTIGADIPFCIYGGTALIKGIGEEVTPLKRFQNHILVLVKPNFGVSTKEVYGSIDIKKIHKHPNTKALIQAIEREDEKFISRNMKNVLENVTLNKHRVLKDIKREMMKMGAEGSLMSGSGPTVFGIFDNMLEAQKCYDAMKKNFNEVYITRTI